jgi:putative membrane protein
MSFRLISTLIFIGIVVVFAIQNVAVVEIKFLVWSIEMSRALLYFIIFVLGLVSGWFLKGHSKQRKKQKK